MGKNTFHVERSISRLFAVQTLYSCEIRKREKNYSATFQHLPDLWAENNYVPNRELLYGVIEKCETNRATIDKVICEFLREDWRLERLESVLRAILRCGACEILFMPHIPFKVIINEYIEITKAFGENEDIVFFVNGIFDKMAKQYRVQASDVQGDA